MTRVVRSAEEQHPARIADGGWMVEDGGWLMEKQPALGPENQVWALCWWGSHRWTGFRLVPHSFGEEIRDRLEACPTRGLRQ